MKDSKNIDKPEIIEKNEKFIAKILAGCTDDKHDRLSTYFSSRGLTKDVPEGILYHPKLFHSKDDHGNGKYFEAMISQMQRLDGTVVGLQRTFLDCHGHGKADVDNAKKMTPALWRGATRGAAIRLGPAVDHFLCVTEGLETGLAVLEAIEWPTWVAGNAGNVEVMVLPDNVDTVIIFADNDKSQTGQNSAGISRDRLLNLGVTVKVMIPENEGEDWLDVYVAKGPKSILKDTEDTPWIYADTDDKSDEPEAEAHHEGDALGDSSMVDKYNKKHFVVDFGGRVCIGNETIDPGSGRPQLTLSSKADLKLKYSNCIDEETGKPEADVWLSSAGRRQYDGIIFAPGLETTPGYYNTFTGFPIKPVMGDCSLYWKHLRDNVCRGENIHYNFLRKWMAHAIQQPSKLPGTAIVLKGEQGTGKGIMVEFFGLLFGAHYLTVYRSDQIVGRFNSHLQNVLLVHANEAVSDGGKVGEGVLKGLVTDPTSPIEYKGKDIVNMKNYKRLIVASNEDNCISVAMDDRRFLILDISSEHKEDKAYFGAICHQMEQEGGIAALMYDLLNEDLTGFDVRTVPYSRYIFNMKLNNTSSVHQWWYELLSDSVDDDWKRVVTKDRMYKIYTDWCRNQNMPFVTKPIFGKDLRKAFPEGVLKESRRATKPTEVDTEAFDVVRRVRSRSYCYDLPSLEDARMHFERYTKSRPDIWPPEDLDGKMSSVSPRSYF